MKANRIFAFAAGVLAMVACQKTEKVALGGLDASKPAVASLSYDAATSGAAAVGLTWSASQAIAAGATSFTVELTEDITTDKVVNGTFVSIITATEAVDYSTVVKGNNSNGTASIKSGSFLFARIRANYPGYIYSNWTYISADGMANPAVCVGTGLVVPEFSAPKNLTATATDVAFTATWDKVAFATTYTFEYKAASEGEWTAVSNITGNSYDVEGLTPETAYDIRVKAFKGEESTEYATATVTTKEKSKFNPNMTTTAQLIEFFTNEAKGASSTSEFTLEADIDLGGISIPAVPEFKGILDGKGHSIKGWKSEGNALFEKLTGTVRNLVVEGSVNVTEAAEGGLLVGTIAKVSTGTVENCTNKAAITVTISGIVNSPVIGGIVAAQGKGTFTGNTNEAAISLTHAGTANVAIDALTIDDTFIIGSKASPFCCIGGVVGLAGTTTIEGCNNNGAVTVTTTNNPAVTARHYIGGIVGTPHNITIKKCINKGAVTANFSEGGTAVTSTGKQVYIAGIAGGRNGDAKDYDGASIDGCENYGDITIDIDYAANHYLSGITGQAHAEAASGLTGTETYGTRVISNCKTSGKLIKKGASQCRIGGISAGAATIDGCENSGEIIIENIAAAGAVGGLVGYPTQPNHTVKNSKMTGKMTSKVDVAFAFGGLFGQGGNTNQSYEGCTVNCVMEAPASVLCGLVLGTAKTLGTGKSIVYGTATAPFKVKGSVRGTAVDGSNLAKLIIGDGGANAGGTIDVSNVTLGD